MTIVLAVAAGGAAGAVGRYFVSDLVTLWLERAIGVGFPYGTLAVNVLGSFILGALVESFGAAVQVSPEVRALIFVGVLGSFTTFSAFSSDTYLLIERGELARAALYVGMSMIISVGAFVGGLKLLRWILV